MLFHYTFGMYVNNDVIVFQTYMAVCIVPLRNECFKPLFLFGHHVQPKPEMVGQISLLVGKCPMSKCYYCNRVIRKSRLAQ